MNFINFLATSSKSFWIYLGIISISVSLSILFFLFWKFKSDINCYVCCHINDRERFLYESVENSEEEEEEEEEEFSEHFGYTDSDEEMSSFELDGFEDE